MKRGARVHLLHGEIRGFPDMTVEQEDAAADKVQIRFTRPGKEGYSYLFWRDRQDVIEEDPDGTVRTRYDSETDA